MKPNSKCKIVSQLENDAKSCLSQDIMMLDSRIICLEEPAPLQTASIAVLQKKNSLCFPHTVTGPLSRGNSLCFLCTWNNSSVLSRAFLVSFPHMENSRPSSKEVLMVSIHMENSREADGTDQRNEEAYFVSTCQFRSQETE